MQQSDWQDVSHIYKDGMETNQATFVTCCPSYEAFDNAHLRDCRLVAVESGAVTAWAALTPVSGCCSLSGIAEVSIYVSASLRGQGIGAALLNALVTESEKAGYWMLEAMIMEENSASIRLHEACGFRSVGYREKYGKDRAGQWHNTILMERRSSAPQYK